MSAAPAQAPAAGPGSHLVLFDGLCGLCSRLVRFILTRDPGGVFVFAALQSATGMAAVARLGANPQELTTFYVVPDYNTPRARLLSRSSGALFIAAELGWPWKLAAILTVVPAAIRDWVYGVVARHRYRVFGRREQCLMPGPEHRDRFIG